ncbi:hypothetical protein [Nitrolancea hollandica]|uniref:Uncharacterized protein n=1 Tax=Nitrolancea hollandica Lb TaxID=1129897 RepID=I4EL34_9BACT|nr:hypothetical protein [Nitrolancea hollandica]CCF85396.1 hypothetical protein NITHO_4920007 [Nitrolancea hollandica Lb]
MGRPPKPLPVREPAGRSQLTRQQLETLDRTERLLLGEVARITDEWRRNPAGHKFPNTHRIYATIRLIRVTRELGRLDTLDQFGQKKIAGILGLAA